MINVPREVFKESNELARGCYERRRSSGFLQDSLRIDELPNQQARPARGRYIIPLWVEDLKTGYIGDKGTWAGRNILYIGEIVIQ